MQLVLRVQAGKVSRDLIAWRVTDVKRRCVVRELQGLGTALSTLDDTGTRLRNFGRYLLAFYVLNAFSAAA